LGCFANTPGSSDLAYGPCFFSVLSGTNPDLCAYRRAFLGSPRISELLDTLWNAEKFSKTFETWIESTGATYVCKMVNKEMELAKPSVRMNLKDVSPAYLQTWDVNKIIMEPMAVMNRHGQESFTLLLNLRKRMKKALAKQETDQR
jgi:hypothetical protein